MKKDVYIIIAAIVFGLIAYFVMTGGLNNLFNKKTDSGPPLVVLQGGDSYDPKTHLFYTPNAKFTVKLPAPPMEYSKIPQLAGWTITTQTPNASYRVAMTRAKIGISGVVSPDHWQTHTQRACSAICNGVIRGTETKGYPYGLKGGTYPGFCSEGTLPDGDGSAYKAQYFVYLPADDRIEYAVVAVGNKEGINSPETKEFFDSFTIIP